MMKNKKLLYGILMVMVAIVGTGLFIDLNKTTITSSSEGQKEITTPTIKSMGDPASIFCYERGGQLKFRKDEKGNEHSVCVFADGTECEEWSFFRGECGRKFTFCEQHGFKIKNIIENIGTNKSFFTVEYAVCIFDDGSECSEQDYFKGRCYRSECKKWRMSEGGCIKSQ